MLNVDTPVSPYPALIRTLPPNSPLHLTGEDEHLYNCDVRLQKCTKWLPGCMGSGPALRRWGGARS